MKGDQIVWKPIKQTTATAFKFCAILTPVLNYRLGYAVFLLNKLYELYRDDEVEVFFLYDIACLLKRHLQVV